MKTPYLRMPIIPLVTAIGAIAAGVVVAAPVAADVTPAGLYVSSCTGNPPTCRISSDNGGQLQVGSVTLSNGGSSILTVTNKTYQPYQVRLSSGSLATSAVVASVSLTGATGATPSAQLELAQQSAYTHVVFYDTGYKVVVAAVPVVSVPAAPSNVVATAGNEQLSVAFTAGSDGGSAVTGYDYAVDGGSGFGAWTSAATTQSPIRITGLTNGTTYSVKLRAVNANGNGAESTAVTGTPSPSAPSAPFGLTATAGDRQLSLAFTAGSDGGSAVTGYDYAVDGGSGFGAWTSAGSTQSPIRITGLSNGTTYSVKLRAVNAVGNGAESSATTGTPVAPQPNTDPAPAPAPAPTSNPSSSPRPATPVSSQPTNLAPEPATRLVPAGQAGVTVGGRPAQVVVSALPLQLPVAPRGSAGAAAANRTLVPNGVAVSGGGVEVKAAGPTIAGTRQAAGLTVPQAAPVSVGAAGFAAGTAVSVYLVVPGREPVLLQTSQADALGVVSTRIAVPENTPQGAAVLQIAGTNGSNERMNVSVGMDIASKVAPQSGPNGVPPRVRAGAAVALGSDGRTLLDAQTRVRNGVARLQSGAVSMTIRDSSDSPSHVGSAETGLTSSEGGYVRVTGSGLAPNSSASVWGFSTPVLLGVVYANAEGAYNVTLPLPDALRAGKHTLQIVATARTGHEISLATGLTITSKVAGTAQEAAKSRLVVTFDRMSSAVSTSDRAQLRRLIREIGIDNIVRTDVVGYVQKGSSGGNDSTLSRARAESVAATLREFGVTRPIQTTGEGVQDGPSDQARSARVTVYYTK